MTDLEGLFPGPLLLIIALGYFLGSIPTAYWLAKVVYRINIFDHGSRNMGATNVHRVLGSVPFAFTLFMDITKGVLAVLLANAWLAPVGGSVPVKILAGLSAIAGHTLSFWVNFRGGKGVATGLGVFLAIAPLSSVGALLVFLVVLILSGYVSLGSITASGCLPVFIFVLGEGGEDWSASLTAVAAISAVFIVYKHKVNIQRLLRGEEKSLRDRTPKDLPQASQAK